MWLPKITRLPVIMWFCHCMTSCHKTVNRKNTNRERHSANVFFLSLQSEIGFGKIESYTKLDKLGEVSCSAISSHRALVIQCLFPCVTGWKLGNKLGNKFSNFSIFEIKKHVGSFISSIPRKTCLFTSNFEGCPFSRSRRRSRQWACSKPYTLY